MNTTFCTYSNSASALHDDDCSSVFGGFSTSNDIENFLSWDFDTDTTSSNTYDFYAASSLGSSLSVPAPSAMLPAANVWGPSANFSVLDGHHAARRTLQCPACGSAITCNVPGQTLHGHVVSCFLERHRDRWSAKDQTDPGERDLSEVQRTISELDIGTRTRLMQSLYRLSKYQDPTKTPAYPLHGSSADVDDPILKLIYTNKADGEPGAV